MYSKITGTGSYFPETVRTNKDLEQMVETYDEWIQERTGMKERRMISDNETLASMSVEASKKAIEAAGLELDEIDFVIVGTTSHHRALPSAACEVQRDLGLKSGIPAMDVATACSGFLYALSVADTCIHAGKATKALGIGSDLLSQLVSPEAPIGKAHV